MSKNANKGIKAQEWMILFDGKIKRSEKMIRIPLNKTNQNLNLFNKTTNVITV